MSHFDKETYAPKFRVGQEVRTYSGDVATITGRKVTRTNARCDTVYQLSDGRSIAEASLEPVSVRLLPTMIAERLVRSLHDRRPIGFYRLDSGWACQNGQMELRIETSTRPGIGAQVTITAPVGADGLVEAVGPMSWTVWREVSGSNFGRWHELHGDAENLGDCIVSVSNAL